MRLASKTAALLVLSVAACSDGTGPDEGRYTPSLVPNVPGTFNWAAAINNAGQIAGGYRVNGITRGYRLGTGPLEDLPPVSGAATGQSAAEAMNDAGWVVGRSQLVGSTYHATLWRPGQAPQDIGPANVASGAVAISSQGQVIVRTTGGPAVQSFRWTASAGLRELPACPGSTIIQASAVNAQEIVAGSCLTPNTPGPVPVVWSAADQITTLPVGSAQGGFPLAINDAGAIVGVVIDAQGDHPAVWTPTAGGGYQLGLLKVTSAMGIGGASAVHINERGEIVGRASVSGVYWASATASPVVLAAIPAENASGANWINDSGLIVGDTGNTAEVYHAIIWNP